MSLGRSSRFYLLGLAKVKSEKVLSSFVSASSTGIRHGSMLCCQDPLTRILVNLDEYGNAQVLESTHKRYVLSSALTGIASSLVGNAMTFSNSEFTLYCWVLPQLPESFPAFAFCSQLAPPMCHSTMGLFHFR